MGPTVVFNSLGHRPFRRILNTHQAHRTWPHQAWNATVVIARDGRVVAYMGGEKRDEFLYKFISNGIYVPGGDTSKLLDEGTLYVARFADKDNCEWVALTPESTGMKMDEICVFTRQAASKVGTTTMDRPEWVVINPVAIEAYCALTNNTNRGLRSHGQDMVCRQAYPFRRHPAPRRAVPGW